MPEGMVTPIKNINVSLCAGCGHKATCKYTQEAAMIDARMSIIIPADLNHVFKLTMSCVHSDSRLLKPLAYIRDPEWDPELKMFD